MKQKGAGLVMIVLTMAIIALLAFGGSRLFGTARTQQTPLDIQKEVKQQIREIQGMMDSRSQEILRQ